MAATNLGRSDWAIDEGMGAGTGAAGRVIGPGASRRVVTTTLLTSLPVRWSALTTLTMRSAAPAVEGESAIAVIAAAEARIKQKHRKMFFPLSIRQKTAFGKGLFPMVSFPCEMGRIRANWRPRGPHRARQGAAPCHRNYTFSNH
jgi:hypothetical protein